MSITARLNISDWQPSSVLRSGNSSLQTCLPPDCLAWLYGCFFGLYWSQILLQIANIIITFLPNKIFLVLLKWESQVNYRAHQFKLLGMPQVERSWMVDTTPGTCKYKQIKWSLLCLWYWLAELCLPSVGGKGVYFIHALGFLRLLTIKLKCLPLW